MAAIYTVKQVADILGYSTNSIYTFLKEKRIKGVRVGRGRFRIPEAELKRVLHLSQSQETALLENVTSSFIVPKSISAESEGIRDPLERSFLHSINDWKENLDAPSLFDWFLGMVSILQGASMILFSQYLDAANIQWFLPWLLPLKVTFLVGGVSVLLTDLLNIHNRWHMVFHLLLCSAYAGFALLLWVTHDVQGALMFGFLALTIVINGTVPIGSIASFALYVGLFTLVVPLELLSSPTSIQLPKLLGFLTLTPLVSAIGWVIAVGLYSLALWWGYTRQKTVFRLLMAFASIFLMLYAIWYAQHLYWGRAFFLLTMGLLSLFIRIWRPLHYTGVSQRRIVFTAFGSLLVLFLTSIGMIWIMQANIIGYASQQLLSKVLFGKSLVESTLSGAQEAVINTTSNPLFVEAIEKKQPSLVSGFARSVFESNRSFRRVLILDDRGSPVSIYPRASLVDQSFAFREYFTRVLATRQPYVGSLSESFSESGNNEQMVVLAAPIVKNGAVIGVLVGSLNLDLLEDRLARVTTAQMDESFVLINQRGKRLLGSEPTDTLRLKSLGQHGVELVYFGGNQVIQAYDTVGDTGWWIAAVAPVSTMLQLTKTASITIVVVVLMSFLIVGSYLLIYRTKVREVR